MGGFNSPLFLQSIFRAAPLGIGLVVDRVFVEVNQYLCEMLGYTAQELIGQSARMIYPDEAEFERVGKEKYAQIDVSGVGSIETRWLRKDGRIIDVLLSSAPIDPSDRKKGVTFTALDITARKRIEEQLQIAEANYRTLVEQVPAVIYIDLPDELSTNLYTSPQILTLTGYHSGELIQDPELWVRMLHPEDQESVLAEHLRTNQTGDPFRMDYRIIHKDGRVIWVRDEAVLERDATGQPLFWRGIIIDITSQKEAELRLKQSEEKFAKAFLTSPDAVNINRLSDGVYLDINEGFTRIMGYERREVLGKSSLELGIWVNPADRARLVQELQANGYVNNLEAPFRTRDGQILTGLMSARVIEIGGETCILSITRDITERKRRERELEAMVRVSAAMRQVSNSSQMVALLAEQCGELFQTDLVLIGLLDEIPMQGKVVYANGGWRDLLGKVLTIPPEALKGEPYPSLEGETDTIEISWLKEWINFSSQWVGVFPLKTSLAEVGWLCIGRNLPLTPHESHILRAVIDMAASSIQRAILYDQTVRRIDRLNALHLIDRTINASLDVNFTANILLSQVVQQLGLHAATLLKFNVASQLFSILATYQYPKQLIPSIYQLENDPPRQAILERKIIWIENLREYTAPRRFFERSAAQGYLGYAVAPLISKGQIKGVMEMFCKEELHPSEDWLRFVQALVEQAAIALENAELFETLQRNQSQLSLAYDGLIEGFARALELRNAATPDHSRRVAEMTVRLARQFGFNEAALVNIRHGALLHDIGHLAVPEAILQKPASLTEEEWDIVHRHPEYAKEILAAIPSLQAAVTIPYCHHEHWDGNGYPRRLKGESIPLEARIFAVVDVWDALRSARPYRPAWSAEQTLNHLREQAGKQFDPRVVSAFVEISGDLEQIS